MSGSRAKRLSRLRITSSHRIRDTEAKGSWTFGKVVHADRTEGYLGVYSARKETTWQDKNSDFYKQWIKDNKFQELIFDFFANKDWLAQGDNLWVIQVGSSHEFWTYDEFKSQVAGARIHIDFGDLECSYDIPGRGRLELHTDISDDEMRERGRFRFQGRRIASDFYPRFESEFVRGGRAEWGSLHSSSSGMGSTLRTRFRTALTRNGC